MRYITFVLTGLITGTSACAATPGAQPHDMSAAHHEAMAAAEDKNAAAHAAQYDPSASSEKPSRCNSGAGQVVVGDGACWTSVVNPTAEHLKEADRHRKMAADHRAASKVLRDAEASACTGLSELDRDMSPFAHREDIVKVEALAAGGSPKAPPHSAGALITFRATQGMTAQWLQHIVDCHLARSAAMGYEVPEMTYCPLMTKNTTAKVNAEAAGFSVEVRSDDAGSAKEIFKRAQALVGR